MNTSSKMRKVRAGDMVPMNLKGSTVIRKAPYDGIVVTVDFRSVYLPWLELEDFRNSVIGERFVGVVEEGADEA